MPSLGRRDAKSIASACALNKSKFVVIMFEIKNPKHQHVWTKKEEPELTIIPLEINP
jgi:hypothetical protein